MWLAVSPSLSLVVFPPHHWGWAYFSQRSRTWLGLKAGTDWEQGLVGADSGLLIFWIECLRLLLRSRPWCSPTLPPEHMLALLRSRCPLGGGSAVSSPSSCLSATWKSRVYQASQTRELFSSLDLKLLFCCCCFPCIESLYSISKTPTCVQKSIQSVITQCLSLCILWIKWIQTDKLSKRNIWNYLKSKCFSQILITVTKCLRKLTLKGKICFGSPSWMVWVCLRLQKDNDITVEDRGRRKLLTPLCPGSREPNTYSMTFRKQRSQAVHSMVTRRQKASQRRRSLKRPPQGLLLPPRRCPLVSASGLGSLSEYYLQSISPPSISSQTQLLSTRDQWGCDWLQVTSSSLVAELTCEQRSALLQRRCPGCLDLQAGHIKNKPDDEKKWRWANSTVGNSERGSSSLT